MFRLELYMLLLVIRLIKDKNFFPFFFIFHFISIYLIILMMAKSMLCCSVVILVVSLSLISQLGWAFGNQEIERLALLSLKEGLVGPNSALSSWNASTSLHFCQWQGVECGGGGSQRQVTSLLLAGLQLRGFISSAIANLTSLRQVSLYDNELRGNIPKQIGQLGRLSLLDLSNNRLSGEIPIEIANCSNLKYIYLFKNNLSGEIPFQFGDMKKLERLSLGSNHLVGAIPPSIGNLSTLVRLDLSYNRLGGTIPESLGRLSSLELILFSRNNLSGTLPPSIYNLSSLIEFSVAKNRLSGELPSEIDIVFPNLAFILIGENRFTGTIPRSISNISGLLQIGMNDNGFSGPVPDNLGNLKNLSYLSISANRLGSGEEGDLHFFSSLKNCTLLESLYVSKNNFGGVFPHSVSNLSTSLTHLYMGMNPITGSIPQGIGNLVNLNDFSTEESFLQGNLPTSIGKLQNLEGLRLQGNNFSGEIPSSIGNLSRLSKLYLDDNNFEGGIPLALGNCLKLQDLDLSKNKLSTSLPNNLFGALQGLVVLNLSYNSFSGLLPSDLTKLKPLAELYVNNNNFSGEVPIELGASVGLRVLFMQNNSFQGNIPQSFGSLKSLENLDLSNNNLSGTIPYELEKLPFLVSLNLSFNQLEGEVPKEGVFKNVSGFSFVGNTKLCGGILELELPKCKKRRKVLSSVIKITIIFSVLLASVLAVLLVYLSWRRRSRKGLIPATALFDDGSLSVTYKELHQATRGFASSNLIGAGNFGFVYKGVLLHQLQEKPVAVKVLNLQNSGAAKSFIAEYKALSKVRHRNLVKIVTACSSIDYQGRDFKALVFDFMSNGNLGSWLHGGHESRYLNLAQRLDIAIDVANAIEYLHHECGTTIVHCDLKPANILLDEDMVAHVADFGLAKLLQVDTSSMGQTSASFMKGTIGYIAPEYGMGATVSPEGDIYSYGILLLEMITGKRPTDALFHNGLSLHSFCKMVQPERLKEVVDFRLVEEIGEIRVRLIESNQLDKEEEIWQCLVSLTKVGVACSAELPGERMRIKDAIRVLYETKAWLVYTGIYKRG